MADEFFLGDRVRTGAFGEGEISIVDGVHPYQSLTIDFEGSGRHVVNPSQLHLELVAPGAVRERLEENRKKMAPPPPPRLDAESLLGQELRKLLREEMGVTDFEINERWEGGEMVLRPGRPGLQEKVIPIDSLWNKIVMVREKLRVLEQKINNHPKLDAKDRLEMQAYVTRMAGSLTTFNVLFADREDWFRGSSTKG